MYKIQLNNKDKLNKNIVNQSIKIHLKIYHFKISTDRI